MFKYGQKDPQKQSFLIPDLDGPCTSTLIEPS